MELARRQAALARLAVTSDLRSRFADSPKATAAELGVTPSEAEDLASGVVGLQQFARSLLRKRLGEVRRLLPRTGDLMGERFDAEFLRFCANRPSQGTRRHERDALSFAKTLETGLDSQAFGALQEECGWIEARLGRRFVIRRLGSGAFAVWLRTGRTVRHWRFGSRPSWTNLAPDAQESK